MLEQGTTYNIISTPGCINIKSELRFSLNLQVVLSPQGIENDLGLNLHNGLSNHYNE